LKIAHIMPVNAQEERKEKVHKQLTQIVDKKTTIDIIDFKNGPTDLEYYEDDFRAISLMLDIKEKLASYDAVNIACFYDPGLRELREALKIPVMGIGLASMTLANLLGHRFSILVGKKKHIPKMEDNSMSYGFHSKIASWRSVDLTVEEFKSNYDLTWERILRESKKAVEEDRAEVIVLGCAALDNIETRLEKELNVPVINPILAGIKLTELMGDMYKNMNLSHSKIYDYENKIEKLNY
jgi:allantoin racemase